MAGGVQEEPCLAALLVCCLSWCFSFPTLMPCLLWCHFLLAVLSYRLELILLNADYSFLCPNSLCHPISLLCCLLGRMGGAGDMRGEEVAGTGLVSSMQPCVVIGHVERGQKFGWLAFGFLVVICFCFVDHNFPDALSQDPWGCHAISPLSHAKLCHGPVQAPLRTKCITRCLQASLSYHFCILAFLCDWEM